MSFLVYVSVIPQYSLILVLYVNDMIHENGNDGYQRYVF